jgi:hypothetical protein
MASAGLQIWDTLYSSEIESISQIRKRRSR